MIPKLQSVLSERGDCLAACLSSLLEIPLEDVPRFHELDDAEWWLDMQAWLSSLGYQFVLVALPENMPWFSLYDSVECMMIGKTANGVLHAVCGECRGEQFLCTFDPLTGEKPRIESIDFVGFLIPRFVKPRQTNN